MRRLLFLLAWMVLGFIGINVMYEVKCMAGIDLLPGHYGEFFPLKEWVADALKD